MLRVGLLGGDTAAVAGRLDQLDTDHTVVVVEQPHSDDLRTCHLVVAVAVTDVEYRAVADASLDGVEDVDALWRTRLVLFATNLAAGRRAPRRQVVVLSEANPDWPLAAGRLIGRLCDAIGDQVVRVDHIGSTSVPDLPAKDLIDLQVVVSDLDQAARVAAAARSAGFVRVGGPLSCVDRHGTEHGEEVVVDADPGRPVNVNIRPITAPIWRETLLFRDWLRGNPAARAEYLNMKRDLAARPGRDVNDYSADKIPWIASATGRAEQWASATNWAP